MYNQIFHHILSLFPYSLKPFSININKQHFFLQVEMNKILPCIIAIGSARWKCKCKININASELDLFTSYLFISYPSFCFMNVSPVLYRHYCGQPQGIYYDGFIIIPFPEEYTHFNCVQLMVVIWQASFQYHVGAGLLGGCQEKNSAFYLKGQECKEVLLCYLFFLYMFENCFENVIYGDHFVSHGR